MESEAMESNEADLIAGITYPDDDDSDSDSVYRDSEDGEVQSPDGVKHERSSRASSVRSKRATSTGKTSREPSKKPSRKVPQKIFRKSKKRESKSEPGLGADEEAAILKQQAQDWAASFQPPENIDIASPPREVSGARAKKKKASKLPVEIKVKRFMGLYNPQYRTLLNTEIHDALALNHDVEEEPLPGSQIGASVWKSSEKETFFAVLSTLGKDNIASIASRIGTKSQYEVQEYKMLLENGVAKQRAKKDYMGPPELPAAYEISEECCTLLETAADALGVRQERSEVETEQGKWGDSWLLTEDVSREIERRRRVEGGREEIDEVLPAANMFYLGEWLRLSTRIFMNSVDEENNWNHIAEEEEYPSIRATAVEDLYSLLVHETKRLVSTTLFCTMSRMRAQNSHRTEKHGDVTRHDVNSAIDILNAKHNTDDFWIKSARRNKLKIINDGSEEDSDESDRDNSEEELESMTYDEVEDALRSTSKRARSRSHSRAPSRSQSRQPAHEQMQHPSDHSDDYQTSDESSPEYDTDTFSNPKESDYPTSRSPSPSQPNVFKDAEAYALAKEAYTEYFDLTASLAEESRLWALLKQTPPEHIKVEALEEPLKAKQLRREVDFEGNWRNHCEFRSQWEVMDKPVEEEELERNRRKRKRERSEERGRRLRESFEMRERVEMEVDEENADQDIDVDMDREEGSSGPANQKITGGSEGLDVDQRSPSPVAQSPFGSLARRQRRPTDTEMGNYE